MTRYTHDAAGQRIETSSSTLTTEAEIIKKKMKSLGMADGDYLMMFADNEEIFVGTAPASAFSAIGEAEDDGDWDDEGWDADWDDEEAAEWDDAVDTGIG